MLRFSAGGAHPLAGSHDSFWQRQRDCGIASRAYVLGMGDVILRAELTGSTICTADGITTTSDTPVLLMCCKLLDAGHDPNRLRAFRSVFPRSLRVRLRSEIQSHAAQISLWRSSS